MMLQLNDKINKKFEDKQKPQILKLNSFQSANYDSLLNQRALIKSVKRNVWSYELKSMLKEFITDVHELKQNLKFKISGKILDSSTYVLKTKTNTIINTSIATREDINELQAEKTACNTHSNDDNDSINDLKNKKCLEESENNISREERVNQALNLNVSDLNKRIKGRINRLDVPPKLIYKKVGLNDLADALNEVLNKKDTIKQIRDSRKKQIDKSKLPFLPNNLIASAEKKRANFENRISEFVKNLKNRYSGNPIPFLKLIKQPTPQAIVEALLCVLHLINHKKIELWKVCNEDNNSMNEDLAENSGQNLFLSPI